MKRHSDSRRGSALVIVIWTVAIAATIVAGLQIVTYRQAVLGNEALARVQARWAARAGLETMIAIMEWHTANPDPSDALALINELDDNAIGELETGSYDIRHFLDDVEYVGPLDEHSKVNINLLGSNDLMNIPDMTPDVAGAITDWRDADDETSMIGAEKTYYANRGLGYEPRNGNLRSFAELELIAGVWPEYTRGEDWNLNGRLDPNEDDGEQSWPDDKSDGILDAGWSSILTAFSRTSPNGASGLPKLNLKSASAEEIAERTGISGAQAAALAQYAQTPNARIENLLTSPLSMLSSGNRGQTAQQGGSIGAGRTNRSSGGRSTGGTGVAQAGPGDLDAQGLGNVLNECTMQDFTRPLPGKFNINTVSGRVLRDVFDMNPKLVDTLLSRRDARPTGLTSVADILEIPGMTREVLAPLAKHLDVQSFVFTVSSVGRSKLGGTEFEILATVDRSTLPAQILCYREP
jgi:type II secretory pathway component PulK